jgi:hypothetical protein
MTTLVQTLTAVALGAALAATASVNTASAQTPSAPVDATIFLPIANEPPPKLFVDAPIPARLAAGAVLIPYRTENFRIVPVFGAGALAVSPRVGHLHVTVDDLPWHWADASDDRTVVIVGLPPGPHKVLLELAQPNHSVLSGQVVNFVVPEPASPAAAHQH